MISFLRAHAIPVAALLGAVAVLEAASGNLGRARLLLLGAAIWIAIAFTDSRRSTDSGAVEAEDPIARLVARIQSGAAIPLTNQVRIDKRAFTNDLRELQAQYPTDGAALARSLEDAARPVPLTADIRLDREMALQALRSRRRE